MTVQGQAQADRAEFEGLFSRSHQRAYNLAYRLTGNETDAEDLTQDAFVRAWGSFERYDRNRPFEVWLLRILSNLAIDRWRRRANVQMHSLDQALRSEGAEVPLGSIIPDAKPGPEQECFARAEGDRIRAALARLPEAYRTAIVLTDAEEWSYEEVARRMQCPVGTVRSRLHRGRVLLRRYLGDTEYGVARRVAAARRPCPEAG